MSVLTAFSFSLLPNVGGFVGGLITRKEITVWYAGLKKPEWRPPNWAFGPVWTTLYTSMGYASYLVYKETGISETAKLPMIAYGTQLALNWAWTPIFFGAHNIKWALYTILAIDASAAACGLLFYRVNKVAGLLFVPYVAWLSLATALTYRIYRDNPDTDKVKEV